MSQIPAMSYSGAGSGNSGGLGVGVPGSPEKNASADKPSTAPPRPSGTSMPKLRSCVTCRTRKVRCDKASPCSNCRRANIPCVVPSSDKPPRWARRLERVANSAKAAQEADPGVSQVMDRLRSLEGLVKELSSQLEQAHAAASASDRGSPSVNSPGSSNQDRDADHHVDSSPAASVHKQFGRLVLGDSGQNRYISSGFWSRVNDEVRLNISRRFLKRLGFQVTDIRCRSMASRWTSKGWPAKRGKALEKKNHPARRHRRKSLTARPRNGTRSYSDIISPRQTRISANSTPYHLKSPICLMSFPKT